MNVNPINKIYKIIIKIRILYDSVTALTKYVNNDYIIAAKDQLYKVKLS